MAPFRRSSRCSDMLRRWFYAVILVTLTVDSATDALGSDANSRAAEPVALSEPGWPQFRGPRRDGISDERGLLQTWPDGGPEQLWSMSGIGGGFSSPVIVRDRIFITGDDAEHLNLLALTLDGRQLWKATNGACWKDPYPGARSSVTYSEGRIYHQNAHGRLACFDAENGKEMWAVELLGQFNGKNIAWGLSECPVVDERAVYATAGGSDALCVALNKTTGELLWKSPPLIDSEGERAVENASYVSPILARFAGRKLLIGCSTRHLYCLDANSGKIQWTRRIPTTYSVIAMMPVLIGDGVFITAPNGKGGRLFRLLPPRSADEPVGAEELWSTRLDTLQGCVVNVGDKLLGAFYPGRKGWAAVNARNGEVLYTAPELIKGAGLYADNRLYALCEDGTMLLLDPAETQFDIKGRFQLANATARDAWAHPVIHNKRLYLRYHDTLSCYDIAGGQ